MQIIDAFFGDVHLLAPKIFSDSRGYFFESYNKHKLEELGIKYDFVQDNQSKSAYGVVRGLHYQLHPHAQTKLIRALSGTILDVVVDIRTCSPTFGQWKSFELSDQNQYQVIIPAGFAHGFSVLSETAVILYKCDSYYNPAYERGIVYNDSNLQIDWQIHNIAPIVSAKDLALPTLDNAEMNFVYLH